MAATVQLLVNPTSGRYSAARVAALRAALAARGADIIETVTIQGTPVLDDRAQHVCAIGGDGSVRHAAIAVMTSPAAPTLSVLPAGTVNLLAIEQGREHTPDDLARRILDGPVRPQHAVALGDTIFLACASVGPEADAVAAVSLPLKRRIGRLAYAVAALRQIARWRRTPIRLEANGRMIACEAFYVAKGRYFAGRWSIAPEAGVEIAEMQVVALVTARRRDVTRLWWAVLRGRAAAALPGVVRFACTRLAAHADTPLVVQADGDAVATLPARFEVLPTPLRFA